MMTLAQIRTFRTEFGNLAYFDLRSAALREADLREADLSGADLSGADLYGADLRRAALHGADLSGADLREADLSGANLREANLSGTGLHRANLRGTTGVFIPNIVDIRGYSPYVQVVDGVVRFYSGCRNFTVEQAWEHWGATYEGDRSIGDRYLAGLAQLDGEEFQTWLKNEQA